MGSDKEVGVCVLCPAACSRLYKSFFFYPPSPETKQELGNKPLLAVSVSLQERGVELRGGEAVAPGRLLQVLLVTNTPD